MGQSQKIIFTVADMAKSTLRQVIGDRWISQGHLQRRIESGEFTVDQQELGDGRMARLAARDLREGGSVSLPRVKGPSRILAIISAIMVAINPRYGLRLDTADRPEWKWDGTRFYRPGIDKPVETTPVQVSDENEIKTADGFTVPAQGPYVKGQAYPKVEE